MYLECLAGRGVAVERRHLRRDLHYPLHQLIERSGLCRQRQLIVLGPPDACLAVELGSNRELSHTGLPAGGAKDGFTMGASTLLHKRAEMARGRVLLRRYRGMRSQPVARRSGERFWEGGNPASPAAAVRRSVLRR